jgi:CBS domain-containing protein
VIDSASLERHWPRCCQIILMKCRASRTPPLALRRTEGENMKVSEIMTTGVQTVSAGAPAATARERMRTKRIHHLLVKRGAQLVGVLSAGDLGRGARRRSAKKVLVADLMTPTVVTVTPRTSVHEAATLMRGRSIGSLIIVDRGRAVGIVTVADLLERMAPRSPHEVWLQIGAPLVVEKETEE